MSKNCPTGKVEYATRPEAQREANRFRQQHGITLSVYGCPHCLFFHLTKKADARTDSDLRRIAACQGRYIAASETAYLRKRLEEITAEITGYPRRPSRREYWENIILDEFRKSLDRRTQRQILKELGFDA